ncbi:ribonuclease domain-containing protein [Fibrobacter sp.]|uniref:ribonuclease domain-containing protein n=1 Tax=Fibrobacter sp. TaxID=35828 RepID=UPI0038666E51
MMKAVSLKIFLAGALTAFFAACSTPTISSDDDEESYGRRSVSSSSKTETSSSSKEKKSSSSSAKSIYEAVEESGLYTTKDSVAAYLCKFDKLPDNYITQKEGIALYESETGKTFEKWNFNPWTTLGVMIGGDSFGNKEGLLPKGSYYEADVDYFSDNRGNKRLVYESDCVIYYTSDHYKSFTQLEVR